MLHHEVLAWQNIHDHAMSVASELDKPVTEELDVVKIQALVDTLREAKVGDADYAWRYDHLLGEIYMFFFRGQSKIPTTVHAARVMDRWLERLERVGARTSPKTKKWAKNLALGLAHLANVQLEQNQPIPLRNSIIQ